MRLSLLSVLALLLPTCLGIPHTEKQTISIGSPCTNDCPDPLTCSGNVGSRYCVLEGGAGAECNTNAFNLCRSHLVCRRNICMRTIANGKPCPDPERTCKKGSSCLGEQGSKTCRRKRDLGMSCGDGSSVCKRKLTCDEGVCKRTADKGESCNSQKVICRGRLTCKGDPGEKLCTRGGGRSASTCTDSSSCNGNRVCDAGICKKQVGRGESCDGDVVCASPLNCVGPSDAPQCHRYRSLNQSCGTNAYDFCLEDLVCFGGICETILTGDDDDDLYEGSS